MKKKKVTTSLKSCDVWNFEFDSFLHHPLFTRGVVGLGIILKILGKLKIKPEVNGGFKVKYSIPLINVFNSLKGFRFKSNTQWCTNQNLIERFGMVINSLSALYSPPLSLPPQPPSTLNLTYIYRFKSNTQSHSLMSTTCRKEERKEKK